MPFYSLLSFYESTVAEWTTLAIRDLPSGLSGTCLLFIVFDLLKSPCPCPIASDIFVLTVPLLRELIFDSGFPLEIMLSYLLTFCACFSLILVVWA